MNPTTEDRFGLEPEGRGHNGARTGQHLDGTPDGVPEKRRTPRETGRERPSGRPPPGMGVGGSAGLFSTVASLVRLQQAVCQAAIPGSQARIWATGSVIKTVPDGLRL